MTEDKIDLTVAQLKKLLETLSKVENSGIADRKDGSFYGSLIDKALAHHIKSKRGTRSFDGKRINIFFDFGKIEWHAWLESHHNGDYYGEESGTIPFENVLEVVPIVRAELPTILEREAKRIEAKERRDAIDRQVVALFRRLAKE